MFLPLFGNAGYDICPRTCDMERAPSREIRQKPGGALPEVQGEDWWFHDLIYIFDNGWPIPQTACDFNRRLQMASKDLLGRSGWTRTNDQGIMGLLG